MYTKTLIDTLSETHNAVNVTGFELHNIIICNDVTNCKCLIETNIIMRSKLYWPMLTWHWHPHSVLMTQIYWYSFTLTLTFTLMLTLTHTHVHTDTDSHSYQHAHPDSYAETNLTLIFKLTALTFIYNDTHSHWHSFTPILTPKTQDSFWEVTLEVLPREAL